MYQVISPIQYPPTADLAEALVEVLGEDYTSITISASAGLYDLSYCSVFSGLRGDATVYRGATLLHTKATSAAFALARGYTRLIVFVNLDHTEFYTYLTGRLFKPLAKCSCGLWGTQWSLLRDRTFSQLATLYSHCDSIEDVRERARMKTRITTHSKYRYKVGPTVCLTFKLASRENLSSGLVRSFFAGILSYVEIPTDTRA